MISPRVSVCSGPASAATRGSVIRRFPPEVAVEAHVVLAALPDPVLVVDELGTLTWRQLDDRIDALAAALQEPATTRVIGIMCRNHRGFVEALVAGNRIGADIVLLITSFAGPALADVVNREGVDTVIYDEEFTATVDRALADKFIGMYVNELTLDYGERGRRGVREFLDRAHHAGLIPAPVELAFV